MKAVFAFISIIIMLTGCDFRNASEEIMNFNPKLSVEEKMELADERKDIEILQEKMPWLNIYSATWKVIPLGDYDINSFIPGPTDSHYQGVLELDSDYLKRIKDEYTWYDTKKTIPESLLTDEMEGYALQRSNDYQQSYLEYLKGIHVVILIDFEKEIVLFSF